MKINKVEELVGITKKNIRFYEEKGLLTPERNSDNGYRDYSETDVEVLQKIKLLRQLSVPIEEILKMQKGYLTLEDCMRRHIITLEREEENVKQQRSVCAQLEQSGEQLANLDTTRYLSLMKEMEEKGVRFMNVKKADKKRSAPILAAVSIIIFMLVTIILLIWSVSETSMPGYLTVILIAMPVLVIVGVLIALRERMKEIEGGEEDAASKY